MAGYGGGDPNECRLCGSPPWESCGLNNGRACARLHSGENMMNISEVSPKDYRAERGKEYGVSDNYVDVLRNAGRTKRYHTWSMNTVQTVGEHTWQLARVYAALWGLHPTGEVALYIQLHDVAELIVGDPPFPVKITDPELKARYDAMEVNALRRLDVTMPEISDVDKARVKVADLLEMTEHGMLEREMGNMHAAPIVLRTERAALEYAEARLGRPARNRVEEYCDGLWLAHERILKAGNVLFSYNRHYRNRNGID